MLVADEWALVRAGRYDVGQFLQLISITAVDMNLPAVLGAAAARLQFIHEYLTDDESRLEYEHWIRERFQPALAVERREGSAAAEGIQLRAALLGLVGRVGRDPHVLSDARRRIETFLCRHP